MGHSWQFALTAVFLEDIVFVVLTLTNVRKWIVDALPLSLKYAVGAGIGLFIAFLGFQNAGIVGQEPTLVTLAFKLPDGSFNGTALLGILGLISYVLLNALCGKFKNITPTMWVLAVIFVLRYIFI